MHEQISRINSSARSRRTDIEVHKPGRRSFEASITSASSAEARLDLTSVSDASQTSRSCNSIFYKTVSLICASPSCLCACPSPRVVYSAGTRIFGQAHTAHVHCTIRPDNLSHLQARKSIKNTPGTYGYAQLIAVAASWTEPRGLWRHN